MKASMGVRARSASLTMGTAGRLGALNDQKSRSLSVTSTGGGVAVPVPPVAPCSIHSRKSVFWADVSFCLPGGILSAATWIHSRLFSGEPGTTAAPPSPPLIRPALLRASSSARVRSPPWQRTQWAVRIGLTSLSKSGAAARAGQAAREARRSTARAGRMAGARRGRRAEEYDGTKGASVQGKTRGAPPRPQSRGWHPWLLNAAPLGLKTNKRSPALNPEGVAVNSQGCQPLAHG